MLVSERSSISNTITTSMVPDKVVWCCLFLLAAFSCRQDLPPTVRVVQDESKAGTKVKLVLSDTVYESVADSTGSALFRPDRGFRTGYADLFYERGIITIYLEENKSLEIKRDKSGEWQFCGECGAINRYLNSERVRCFQIDCKPEEARFLEDVRRSLRGWQAHLDSLGLEEAFVQMEKKRLQWVVANRLVLYPFAHARISGRMDYVPSEKFYRQVEQVFREEDSLCFLYEYRVAFKNLVKLMGNKGLDNKDPLSSLKGQLHYIADCLHGPCLTAFLVDESMSEYVAGHGVDGLEPLLPFYMQKVTDPDRINRFENLYRRWLPLARGKPSPEFSYKDISGQVVGLRDLRGKYVYIDLWATWCYFCCKEIPDLKKLEARLHRRNICFVSISVDKDRTAWEKKVKADRLGGIQLIAGEDRSFRNAYLVEGIPRFILLDPEGKIVDANMSRPSDPETFRFLNSLPGL